MTTEQMNDYFEELEAVCLKMITLLRGYLKNMA